MVDPLKLMLPMPDKIMEDNKDKVVSVEDLKEIDKVEEEVCLSLKTTKLPKKVKSLLIKEPKKPYEFIEFFLKI